MLILRTNVILLILGLELIFNGFLLRLFLSLLCHLISFPSGLNSYYIHHRHLRNSVTFKLSS